MKPFLELSTEEIEALSSEEFAAVSPFEKHSCADCAHLQKVVSLWCGNKFAIAARGTRRPGIIKCPYWAPDWNKIPDKYKTEENGFLSAFDNNLKAIKRFLKSFLK